MKVHLSYFQLSEAILRYVDPALREGDLETCIEWTNRMLGMIPKSPYHIVEDLEFSTSIDAIAKKFDEWVIEQEADSPFGIAYTETNAFGSNPDEWHFHWFAYASAEEDDFTDMDDSWISKEHERVVLTGMESLQIVFQRAFEDEEWFARDICECQVLFKFMKLMQDVSMKMTQFRHPLVVSSHDWGAALRIDPTTASTTRRHT